MTNIVEMSGMKAMLAAFNRRALLQIRSDRGCSETMIADCGLDAGECVSAANQGVGNGLSGSVAMLILSI
jgi:hypothetical protein